MRMAIYVACNDYNDIGVKNYIDGDNSLQNSKITLFNNLYKVNYLMRCISEFEQYI